jgi:beta-lactamase superfamily II metal-dependent hydrolase
LFTGDALPQPIIDSLKKFGYTTKKPLEADFVKLSHHGSKKNTNSTLLNLIKSENFLISTDSDVHGLPDKRCLARVIKGRKKVNLYFNYPELATQLFSEQDLAEFPYIRLLSAQEPIKR